MSGIDHRNGSSSFAFVTFSWPPSLRSLGNHPGPCDSRKRRPGAVFQRESGTTRRGDGLANIKIENVVASGSLGDSLDLEAIVEADALVGAEYKREVFPGLIYRLEEPKTAVLLFSSGKVVCTGAKNLEQVKLTISKVAERIERAGIEIKEDPEIEIQNIVACADLETELNMNAICISMGLENVEYEPEQFPGLVYR
ncbi:MAG: TATA-box-binding protein, partial [Thermoplasmata archaeon]|nr:TATA-box-binding protein [Thermoplasmata archaeon]